MKYPITRRNFGAHFHQDWDLCGPDWQTIVDQICHEDTPDGLKDWIVELRRILNDFSDKDLQPAMYSVFRLYYVPSGDGYSDREW